MVNIKVEADFEKYKGKLRGKVVMSAAGETTGDADHGVRDIE